MACRVWTCSACFSLQVGPSQGTLPFPFETCISWCSWVQQWMPPMPQISGKPHALCWSCASCCHRLQNLLEITPWPWTSCDATSQAWHASHAFVSGLHAVLHALLRPHCSPHPCHSPHAPRHSPFPLPQARGLVPQACYFLTHPGHCPSHPPHVVVSFPLTSSPS